MKFKRGVALLGERLNGIQEVVGLTPIVSTITIRPLTSISVSRLVVLFSVLIEVFLSRSLRWITILKVFFHCLHCLLVVVYGPVFERFLRFNGKELNFKSLHLLCRFNQFP